MSASFNVYGLIIALSILICGLAVEYLAKRESRETDIFWGAMFWTILFGVIGARIYHVIDLWEYYRQFPFQVFFVWNGGLGIIGGIILGGAALSTYLFVKKQNILEWLDLAALTAPMGQALGRWGNVANQELLSLAYYEMVFDWVLFGVLLIIYSFLNPRPKGFILFTYLIGYTIVRIVLQPMR